LYLNYNFHSIFLIIEIVKSPIRTPPKKKNVPLNQKIPISNPHIISPKTLARLSIILSGAADALESISDNLRLIAYD
jgi:hypothetical protein